MLILSKNTIGNLYIKGVIHHKLRQREDNETESATVLAYFFINKQDSLIDSNSGKERTCRSYSKCVMSLPWSLLPKIPIHTRRMLNRRLINQRKRLSRHILRKPYAPFQSPFNQATIAKRGFRTNKINLILPHTAQL